MLQTAVQEKPSSQTAQGKRRGSTAFPAPASLAAGKPAAFRLPRFSAGRSRAPRIPAPPGIATTRPEHASEQAPPLDSCASFATASGEFWYRTDESGATVLFCEAQSRLLFVPRALGGAPVTAIATNACSDLTEVEQVVLPATVRRIGAQAFARCSRLTRIDFGQSLESIEEGAFRGCASLKRVEMPGTLRSIGESAFSNSALQSIYLPASCTTLGEGALCTGPSFPGSAGLPYASSLQSITVDAVNPCFHMEGDVLCRIHADGAREAILCIGKARAVELGENIARVAASTFAGTTAIESLRLRERIELPRDCPLLPNRSCDRITIDFATPRGNARSLSLELPEGASRGRILAQATHDGRLSPEALACAYDEELPQVEDGYSRTRLMAARLARPTLLRDDARALFQAEAEAAFTNVCVHAGGRNDWQVLDDLIDAGVMTLERIADAVSALNKFGFALAAAHVLNAKRKRFGGAYADYAL